jgi:ribosomal protein S19E (S16A)
MIILLSTPYSKLLFTFPKVAKHAREHEPLPVDWAAARVSSLCRRIEMERD